MILWGFLLSTELISETRAANNPRGKIKFKMKNKLILKNDKGARVLMAQQLRTHVVHQEDLNLVPSFHIR